MRTVNVAKAMHLLRKVAEDREDFVYDNGGWGGSGCHNFRDGQPSCIVGHVFAELGLMFDKAVALGISGSVGVWTSASVLRVDEGFGWEFTDDALRVLQTAQAAQDLGETWGRAVAEAQAVANGFSE